ncbi:right-handed parallel beta-helix repeat-containing protein [Lachnospira multipara]|uniref:right-handed parallel beta-helix repeat-containing protein n=1 Tax=Lachnospira multipara TaxID=28051 RepID=UPI0004E1AED2|nr:right-handed parallel beta-helix repeat-containing protein [Lachnospira multipara]
MKTKMRARIMSIAMAILMVVGLMPTDFSVVSVRATEDSSNTHVFETSTLTATAAGTYTDGQEITYDDYFTIVASSKTKIDSSSKTFDDEYTSGQRLNFGGKADIEAAKNYVSFKTSASATVKIWWAEGGEDNRSMAIYNLSNGEVASQTSETLAKNAACVSTLTLSEAGTYALGGLENNNYIFKIEVTETPTVTSTVNTFETSTLKATAAGTYTDGQEIAYDDYFTIVASSKTKIDSSSKTFDDEYTSGQRLNFGGKADIEAGKNYVSFKTSASATVKIWWAEGGDDNRSMAIYNLSSGKVAAQTSETLAKNAACVSTLTLSEAGTYALGGLENNNYIFKIEVTETSGEAAEVVRADWSEVANPTVTNVVDNGDGTVTVDFDALIGTNGADGAVVTLTDTTGESQTSKYLKEGNTGSKTFTVSSSGTYTATVSIYREGEVDKTSESKEVDFVLPLENVTINSVTSTGNGTVLIDWTEVKEADSYIVSYSTDGENYVVAADAITDTEYTVTGLTVGTTYKFKVQAVRRLPATTTNGTVSDELEATKEAQTVWGTITYGNGANESNFTKVGDINKDGKVQLTAGKLTNGKLTGSGNNGKLVPASFDGLSFYYTSVPTDKNFTLRAKVNVDQWYLSNGQEGFGLMAADQLGGSGWNNSYMAVVSKSEYYADAEGKVTTDTTATKVTQKIGIASQEKTGLTKENLSEFEANNTAVIIANFKTSSYPLEQRYASSGNVIGNNVNSVTSEQNITEMYLTIQKNNTGYFVTYESVDGSYSVTKKYYDTEALSQIDSDSVYVGFFVSRFAQATFSDVTLNVIDKASDAPAEEQPVETIETVATIDSADSSNAANYELKFNANADGKAVVYQNGVEIANVDVKDGKQVVVNTVLNLGDNTFQVKYDPTDGYKPGEFKVMSSYDEKTLSQTVKYQAYTGDIIYVAPNANGVGTNEDPADLQTAIKFAQPGQTIVVKEGTYSYNHTLTIPRGTNGTSEKEITLVADENATTRPVISGENASGHAMEIAGDYWYIKGIDVTKSADGKDGIHLSGSHNTVDNVECYKNGNTGLQISRLSAADADKSTWPSYNYILNCTSYDNADHGYEDADGFAAKLTCGDGNVFDGCIAHNNADDGWDLFAKVQSGAIGVVTIKNSVAYANGYLSDGTNAGNGNGFKMGGDSMTGYHKLINCVAFDNKSKGIDSNSCPDIQISDSTSFNNEANNVALYTNTAANTDFSATGILSFRTENTDNGENFKLKGTQDTSKVYQATNYFWLTTDGESKDASKEVSADWFESVDTKMNYQTHVYKELPVTRNADGTINMNGLLVLTDKAAANTGATLNASTLTASKTIEVTGDVTTGLTKDNKEEDKGIVYEVLNGDGQTVVKGNSFVVRSAADFNKFVKVLVDGNEVDPANYTVTEGSTVVTFTPEYSSTLADGTHEVVIVSTDGEAKATITVASADNKEEVAADVANVANANTATNTSTSTFEQAKDNAKTGDNMMLVVYAAMMLVAGVAVLFTRKKKNA